MALFDAKAETYDNFCSTPLGHFIDTVERALVGRVARPRPQETAIDLGCGTGAYAAYLKEQGLSVMGVDISAKMLAVARRKASDDATFIQSDLVHLPLPSERFDLAICNVVLEFVPDPEAVLSEGYRILKPGGHLVAGLIGKHSPWAERYARRGQEDPSSVYHHARFYSYDDIRSVGPNVPSEVQFGLYVSADEFQDEESAWMLENQRRMSQQEIGAGFMAIRWNKA